MRVLSVAHLKLSWWALVIHGLFITERLSANPFSLSVLVFMIGTLLVWLNRLIHKGTKYHIGVGHALLAHLSHILPMLYYICTDQMEWRTDVLLVTLASYTLYMCVSDVNPLSMYLSIPRWIA